MTHFTYNVNLLIPIEEKLDGTWSKYLLPDAEVEVELEADGELAIRLTCEDGSQPLVNHLLADSEDFYKLLSLAQEKNRDADDDGDWDYKNDR